AATPLHLYDDVPYEAPGEGAEPEGCCPPGARCRYSWLPEDDERPSEEYDQPWEWKKERISRVFAVFLPQGMEAADLQLPSCPEKSGSPCWLSVEHGLAFGERVNPSLPLESQAWYHGRLSRVGAEGLLRLCREASYLVRNSESTRDAFSLSLRSSQGFLHMQLLRTEDHKFVLGQHSPPFDNVPQVIHHYAKHRLPIQGAEHMTLLYPVATQPSPCLVAEQ
uniref:SH2 domain-containing adapter protein D n=1 Tax=Varanus komodoensis TaxID=61221 RepID=A0A8D2JDN6_VARKO